MKPSVTMAEVRYWSEMSMPELEEVISGQPVVYLPIGSMEGHGPHLPSGTDWIQAEHIVDQLAQRTGGIILPGIGYGVCNSTDAFLGTISISFETLYNLAHEVMTSVAGWDVRYMVVISSHAGRTHMAAIDRAAKEVSRETGMIIMMLSDYDLAYGYKGEVGTEGGHGGAIETSRIMAIRGDLVGDLPTLDYAPREQFVILPDPEKGFPMGARGDLTKASKDLGDRINSDILDQLERMVMEMKDRH